MLPHSNAGSASKAPAATWAKDRIAAMDCPVMGTYYAALHGRTLHLLFQRKMPINY